MAPTEVSFGLSPSYSLLTAREAHDWFLEMMREHEEFEVETDRAGELPMPFWSETVRWVVVDPFAAGGSTIDICKKRLRRHTYVRGPSRTHTIMVLVYAGRSTPRKTWSSRVRSTRGYTRGTRFLDTPK